MNIRGYAFQADEKETRERYSARYEEIKHFGPQLNLSVRSDYARNHFSGELNDQTRHLSELDLALIADRGNLCFGGCCTKSGNTFRGEYNTD